MALGKSDVRLRGLDKLLVELSKLSKAAEGKVARRAVRAASRPVVVAARGKVPKDTGNLKKSMGVRIKTYRKTGVTISVIGPRRGFWIEFDGKRRIATRYAHLVEYGTKHSPADPFMRPAFESTKSASFEAMNQAVRRELIG